MISTKSPTTTGLYTTVMTKHTPDSESEVISFYLNCYLALVPRPVHARIIEELTEAAQAGKIILRKVTVEEYDTYRGVLLDAERVMMCALMAVTSFTKQGTAAAHLNDWCKNRSGAMFARAGLKPIPVPSEFVYELPILANYLLLNRPIRAALLKPILLKTPIPGPGDILYEALKSQIDLITQFYALSTVKLAAAFAEMCDTEAHTLVPVIEQCVELIDNYTNFRNRYANLDYNYYHHCVIEEREPWMEAAKFADVVYCAQLRQVALGDKTWGNYKMSNLATTQEKGILGAKTAVSLESTAAGGQILDPRVLEFLAARGKQVAQNASADPRVLGAMRTT